MTRSPSWLLQLPTELIVAICQALDLPGVVAFSQICRTLNTIINQTPAIQYKLELELYGMVDDKRSKLPIVQRLELLRRNNEVWQEWTISSDIKQSGGRLPTYDFQKGILAIGKSTIDPSFTSAIEFHQLKSKALDSPAIVWSCPDLGLQVKDFTTDPDQDLIVLLEIPVPSTTSTAELTPGRGTYRLHFRRMTATEGILASHPRATAPILSAEVGLQDGFILDPVLNDNTLFIRGNLFAFVHTSQRISSSTGITEVRIWDWPAGKLIHEYSIENESAFTFLDDSSYLLIGHCNINWRTTRWHAEIHTSDQEVSESRAHRFNEIVVLALPDLVRPCEVYGMNIRSDPNDSDTLASNPDNPFLLSNSLPFKPSSNRIIALNFLATPSLAEGHGTRFTVFILTSKLLQLSAGRPRGSESTPIPWDDWGPESTRWTHGLFQNSVVCNMHGLRYLTVPSTHRPRISIMDFNVYSIKKDVASPRASPHDPWEGKLSRVATRLITEPTYLSFPHLFSKPLVSYLPYKETTIPFLPMQVNSGLMMDDQRVVIFDVSRISAMPIAEVLADILFRGLLSTKRA
ncbi:hypothetical protein FRB90_005735 [Tulasnella sp. 427]|nr:hypothetical protein FRB90_005735 [Tulasnella sp. 427]